MATPAQEDPKRKRLTAFIDIGPAFPKNPSSKIYQ
jgi:hypothetical protein